MTLESLSSGVEPDDKERRQICPGNPEWDKITDQRINWLLAQQKTPSFPQKLFERLATIIRGVNGYGSERSQPMPRDFNINRRNSGVVRY